MTRKIHIPEVARVKRADPKNDFVFSDDIAEGDEGVKSATVDKRFKQTR
jgi:hypothetical protein